MSERLNSTLGSVLISIARLTLGAVFLYACWNKILDPAGFSEVIRNYQILPPAFVEPMAQFLPWIELVSGISLIINRWVRGAALVISLLMMIFIGALGYNMIRGVDVSCGCFTLNQEAPASMWYYMIRDSLLLVMAVGIVVYPFPKPLSQGHP